MVLDSDCQFLDQQAESGNSMQKSGSVPRRFGLNLTLMCVLFLIINLVYFMTLYMSSAFKGQKLYANLSFGIAEFMSALFCGFICKYVS